MPQIDAIGDGTISDDDKFLGLEGGAAKMFTATSVATYVETEKSASIVASAGMTARLNATQAAAEATAAAADAVAAAEAAALYTPSDTRGRLAATAAPRAAAGRICFTWDDGYTSHASQVAPLAATLKQRHTFFVTSDLIDGSGTLTSAQVTALYAAGHEIGSHAQTHVAMTGLTATQRDAQYIASIAALEALTASGAVKNFSYPTGARSATTDSELWARFDHIFGIGTDGGYLVPDDDRRGTFLVCRYSWTQASHAALLNLIRLAANTPVTLIVYAHDPGNGSGSFSGDPTLVEMAEAMTLANTLGVPCVSITEALGQAGSLLANPGFETGDLTGWATTTATPSTSTAAAALDTPDTGLPGLYSAKLSITGGATDTIHILQSGIPVTPGAAAAPWTLTLRYRIALASGAGSAQVHFKEYDYSGAVVATTVSAPLASSSWAKTTRALTLNASTRYVGVDLWAYQFVGDAFFDHVHIGPTTYGSFG